MAQNWTQQEKTSRGAADAGAYFRYMTQFVGFNTDDAHLQYCISSENTFASVIGRESAVSSPIVAILPYIPQVSQNGRI